MEGLGRHGLLGMQWPMGCGNMNAANHYALLGVASSAPLAVIRAAHRAQMREQHPDVTTGNEELAKALNEALRVLQDEQLRAAYDASLRLDLRTGGNRGDRAETGPGKEGQAVRDAGVRTRARSAAAEAIRRERERDEARARREACARANARWFAHQDPTRLVGLDVFARSEIRLASMRWHQRTYPPLLIREPGRRGPGWARIGALLLLAIVMLLACVPAAIVARGSRAPGATVLLLLLLIPLPALLGAWARASGRAGPWPIVPYVLFLAYAGGLLVPALAGGPAANPVPLIWLFAYLVGVETFRATTAPPRRPRAKRLLDPEQVRERTSWEFGPTLHAAVRRDGDSGDGDCGDRGIGDGGIGGPDAAEILTGQLLAHLDRLPGSRTIHPLAFPGDPNRRVGHGVLCGNRLALVESIHCPGGQYFWWQGRLLGQLPGRDPADIGNRFPVAVAGYRRVFPELQVRGWSVFHAGDGAAMLTNNQAAGELPRLVTAEMALREVGDWLAGGEPNVVDRQALSALVLGFGRGERLLP